LKRIWVRAPVAAIVIVALGAGSGCGRGDNRGAPAQKVTALADAVRPDFFAGALRRIGGAHFQSTARFTVAQAGAAPNAVTTTTDVWVDRAGNYRIKEENDRDGGREVVLTGRELAVALRYGKMIRRIAEEPEPARLLEEALGAPFAAFELVAPSARVVKTGDESVGGARASVFELQLGEGKQAAAAPGKGERGARPAVGLREWRGEAVIDSLSGRVVVDDSSGVLFRSDIAAKFTAKTGAGAVQGAVEVRTVLSDVAAVAPIEKPAAEDLAIRQRTLPEQRELLRGLAQTRAAAEPTRVRAGARPQAANKGGGK
jgi:hypothetical protein